MYQVLKAFKTSMRRFVEGDTADAEDFQSPAHVARMIDLGHIAPAPPVTEAPIPEPMPVIEHVEMFPDADLPAQTDKPAAEHVA